MRFRSWFWLAVVGLVLYFLLSDDTTAELKIDKK